jgi:hypothetical protein
MTMAPEIRTAAQPSPERLPRNSQSEMFLQATQLVADLHQRGSFNTPAMLRALIEGAATSVPGAQYAGITVTQKRRPSQTSAATHRYPVMLDEIQSLHQQGPCLTAAASQESVRVDDLNADNRWPLYRAEALKQTPIRSILSYGIFREGATAAALNFYAEPVNAFDDGSVNLGLIFATHTALVWTTMRRDLQFRAAIVSRDVIGQAKGRLMERFDIDADAAFDLLRRISQENNTPITQIAHRIVTGDRPRLPKQPR